MTNIGLLRTLYDGAFSHWLVLLRQDRENTTGDLLVKLALHDQISSAWHRYTAAKEALEGALGFEVDFHKVPEDLILQERGS